MASTKDKKKKRRRRRRVRAPPQENVRASNLARATPTNILLEQQALGRLIKNVSTAGLDYSQPVYDEYVRNIHQRSIAQRYNRPDVNEILGVRARQLVRNLVHPHGHAPARERSQRAGIERIGTPEPPGPQTPPGSPPSEFGSVEGHAGDYNIEQQINDRARAAEAAGELIGIDLSPIKQERDIRLQEDLGQVADRAVQGLEGIDRQLKEIEGDVSGMEANLDDIPEVSAISGPPQAEEPPQEESLISTGKESAFERYVTPEAQIRRPQNPVASFWDDDVPQESFQAEDDYDPYEEAKSDDTPTPGTPTPSYLADYDTDTDAQLEYNYDETPSTSAEYTSVTPSTSEEYTSVTPTLLDKIQEQIGGEILPPLQYEKTAAELGLEKTETRFPRLAAEVDQSNIINTPENQVRTLRSRVNPTEGTPATDLFNQLQFLRTATKDQIRDLMVDM